MEGPDGAGKTTEARLLAGIVGGRYVHCTPFLHHKERGSIGRLYIEAMLPALLGYQTVVMDRCWLSEPIYATVVRKKEPRLDPIDIRMIERVALRCAPQVVVVRPPFEVTRNGTVGREEYANSVQDLKAIWGMYGRPLGTCLPTTIYDRTKVCAELGYLLGESRSSHNYVAPRAEKSPEKPPKSAREGAYDSPGEARAEDPARGIPIVRESLERRRGRHPAALSSAGSLEARVVLVGSRPGDPKAPDPFYRWPFVSFSDGGCSRWFTTRLLNAGVEESDLLWINAAEVGVTGIRHLAKSVRSDAFWFLMGKEAADVVLEHPPRGIRYEIIEHPQYWNRCHHSRPWPSVYRIANEIERRKNR
jgi:hypothetical protein